MTTHMQLHQRSPLTPAHFQQWLKLFTSTADELFAGPNTELIKQRAISIGTIMQAKMS
jgi:hemoglobin